LSGEAVAHAIGKCVPTPAHILGCLQQPRHSPLSRDLPFHQSLACRRLVRNAARRQVAALLLFNSSCRFLKARGWRWGVLASTVAAPATPPPACHGRLPPRQRGGSAPFLQPPATASGTRTKARHQRADDRMVLQRKLRNAAVPDRLRPAILTV